MMRKGPDFWLCVSIVGYVINMVGWAIVIAVKIWGAP